MRPALLIQLTAVSLLLQSATPAPAPSAAEEAAAPDTSSSSTSPLFSGISPVLLISFDGFRASYLDAQPRQSLPNLNAFWEGGVRSAITPRFVSKTFPNHYSLVTGLHEQHHGIVGWMRVRTLPAGNNMWDPYVESWFSMRSKESFWWDGGGSAVSPGQAKDVEPIWVTARREGMESRVYFWPGSEAEIRGVRPTEYHPYDDAVPFEDRVDAAAEWLAAAHKRAMAAAKTNTGTGTSGTGTSETGTSGTGTTAGNEPTIAVPAPVASFHALYFEEPDGAGHAHGPHSKEVNAAVQRVDKILGRLREKTGEAAWNATNVVIVADHGMATVSRQRVIHLGEEPCGVDFSKVAVSGGVVHSSIH